MQGEYKVNNTLTRFEGCWRWTNGPDTVWLTMQKQKVHYIQIPCDWDEIIGWHQYKKDNTVIESNYKNAGIQYSPSTRLLSSIFGGNDPGLTPDLFEGTIKDISKSKTIKLTLSLNAAQNQLVWKTKNVAGTVFKPYDYGFTLPTSMIFFKQ